MKRNQPTLQQEMTAVFLDAFDARRYPEPIADRPGIKFHFDDVKKGHGRLEQHITVVASMEKKMECAGRWEALAALANENAAQNLGVVRRLVLNLLSEVEPRRSVPYKQRECSHDPEFRMRVLDRRPQ